MYLEGIKSSWLYFKLRAFIISIFTCIACKFALY